jgi:hypothetical protein
MNSPQAPDANKTPDWPNPFLGKPLLDQRLQSIPQVLEFHETQLQL